MITLIKKKELEEKARLIRNYILKMVKPSKSHSSVSIFNVSTVKPLDKEKVKEIAEKFKKIIIAEEHSVIGGLS